MSKEKCDDENNKKKKRSVVNRLFDTLNERILPTLKTQRERSYTRWFHVFNNI